MAENGTLTADIPSMARPQVYRLGDLLDQWDNRADELHEARLGNRPLGVVSGLPKVDEAIGGTFQPGLHSIQGGPGVGKTAFGLQVAAQCGCPALFVTCEMAPLELLRRITARVTNTFLGKLKTGELPPEKMKDLVRYAIETCPDLHILDCTRGHVPAFGKDPLNLYDLAGVVRADNPHSLIVIDSLHSWASPTDGRSTEYETLNAAIAELIRLAAALACPVIAIAERAKGQAESGGIMAGAGTRKIAYSAESVIELDSTDKASDANMEKAVTMKLSKNRNGDTGRPVDLKFNGALMKFREV